MRRIGIYVRSFRAPTETFISAQLTAKDHYDRDVLAVNVTADNLYPPEKIHILPFDQPRFPRSLVLRIARRFRWIPKGPHPDRR